MSRIELVRVHACAQYLPLLWLVRQSGAAVEHNDVIPAAASILVLSVFLPCHCPTNIFLSQRQMVRFSAKIYAHT